MEIEMRRELKDEKLEKVTGGSDAELYTNGNLKGNEASEKTEQSAEDVRGLEIIGPYVGGVCGGSGRK